MGHVIPLPGRSSPLPPQMDFREWGTKKQAARQLGVSTKTLDRYVNAGLPRWPDDPDGLWTYVGSRRRFRVSHLSMFAEWSNSRSQ